MRHLDDDSLKADHLQLIAVEMIPPLLDICGRTGLLNRFRYSEKLRQGRMLLSQNFGFSLRQPSQSSRPRFN